MTKNDRFIRSGHTELKNSCFTIKIKGTGYRTYVRTWDNYCTVIPPIVAREFSKTKIVDFYIPVKKSSILDKNLVNKLITLSPNLDCTQYIARLADKHPIIANTQFWFPEHKHLKDVYNIIELDTKNSKHLTFGEFVCWYIINNISREINDWYCKNGCRKQKINYTQMFAHTNVLEKVGDDDNISDQNRHFEFLFTYPWYLTPKFYEKSKKFKKLNQYNSYYQSEEQELHKIKTKNLTYNNFNQHWRFYTEYEIFCESEAQSKHSHPKKEIVYNNYNFFKKTRSPYYLYLLQKAVIYSFVECVLQKGQFKLLHYLSYYLKTELFQHKSILYKEIAPSKNFKKKHNKRKIKSNLKQKTLLYGVTSSIKFAKIFMVNKLEPHYLLKNKVYNKGRYSRCRQNYRTGVYLCLYLSIVSIFGLYFIFYRYSFNFTYLWWFFVSFVGSFFASKIINYRLYEPSTLITKFFELFYWLKTSIYLLVVPFTPLTLKLLAMYHSRFNKVNFIKMMDQKLRKVRLSHKLSKKKASLESDELNDATRTKNMICYRSFSNKTFCSLLFVLRYNYFYIKYSARFLKCFLEIVLGRKVNP